MKSAILLLLFLGVATSSNAYAYLDPASGNAIVSFFIALFGSAIFFAKSVFYRLFSRTSVTPASGGGATDEHLMPLIFSEGKTYWTTFRPVVEEFIRREIHFRYISLDVHDPGLMIDSVYMHSRRISNNRLGFAKIANLRASVMLSTTPNIGSEGYPMDRPAGVQNLVHVFHAMVDLSCYRKGSLDFYDSVLMVGAHEESAIRLVEEARSLPEKNLIVAGLPCLDDLNRQKRETHSEAVVDEKAGTTVLIAPSWGAKGCFSEYGTGFIKTLSAANYHVIIRLHPHSRIFEPESVERWLAETRDVENVVWDDNTFGTQAMAQADILISDASSIRFDFAFLYEKPVISLPISRESRSIFEGDYMPETWADKVSEEIGVVAGPEKLATIDGVVQEAIDHFTPERLAELRDRYVANFDNSAAVIVEYLRLQAELLSMTPEEQSLVEQVATLKAEVKDLQDKLHQAEASGFKAVSG
ncbi:MAG: CDP-glycerol glycerophosphotransferase family protein [Halioglobus sp.]